MIIMYILKGNKTCSCCDLFKLFLLVKGTDLYLYS